MSTPLLAYHSLVLAVLLALLGIVVVNLLVLPKIGVHTFPPGKTPKVAILIPARNEEANIEACLLSLLAQDYPDYEVWLYDDASTDHTLDIATRVAKMSSRFKVEGSKSGTPNPQRPKGTRIRNPQLHVVRGTDEPPPGWLGKNHACYRLYLAMRGHSEPDYVLFTDADVRFAPSAVSHAVATAQARGAGLLSIFPRQVTVSWAERLAVPGLSHVAVYTFLPLPLAFSMRTGPAFAAANGQFMLFTREAYESCGGHSRVRSQVLEDVALARAVKRAGHRALLADGGPLVRTRMYYGPSDVWEGYSKNVFAFFGYSPFFLVLGTLALSVLYVIPPALAIYSALLDPQSALLLLVLAQYGVAVLGRLLLAMRFAYRWADTLLHPVAVLFVITIALNSMRWRLTGRGAWKGRAVEASGQQRD